MAQFFETEYYGKYEIASTFCRCTTCRRLTLLNSYSTTRFLQVLSVPFIPLGKFRMMDECPVCGQRATRTHRKFAKERKRNLSLMMEGFAEDPDNPDNCCHALHTLMVYNEKSWFDDVRKSYGMRFYGHMQIQYVIAQGLCRFGDYEEAIVYCRKAIVLGAGPQAEELLEFCHTLMESAERKQDLRSLEVHPESARKAYVPIISAAALFAALFMWQGISAMRTHRAWLVNGSLQEYSFVLDGKNYTLAPGRRKQIKLKLGTHTLEREKTAPLAFDYSIPLIKQLLGKQLLVINPDSMALLSMADNGEETYSCSKTIHSIPGIVHPLFGFQTLEHDVDEMKRISLFRPDNHTELIARLQSLELEEAAVEYARNALLMTPDTEEAPQLLALLMQHLDDRAALTFLRKATDHHPALLPWHLEYQDRMLSAGSRPELVKAYSEKCRKYQEEPEWSYLLGRVLEDPENAAGFFQYSEKGTGMNGLGFYSIAENHFYRGDYADALPWAVQALEKDPANSAFAELRNQLLLALRRYDDLLSVLDPENPEHTERYVLYLTCAGFHREAEHVIASYEQGNAARLNAIRFHAVGNIADYLECVADTSDHHAQLKRLYHLNQIENADLILSENVSHPWWEHLMMYKAAMLNRKPEIARTHLEKAIAEIDSGTPAGKAVADLLTADKAPDPNSIRALRLRPAEKALLCTALASRFPHRHTEFTRLSNLYNFEPAYPWLYLKRWNAQPQPEKPTALLIDFQALEPAA